MTGRAPSLDDPGRTGRPRPPRRRSAALAAASALPALLAWALYGWHLGDGLLADDFLYASWARTGIRELLRHTTIASIPQMIRPLPALVWMLVLLPSGAVLLHAVSVALHAANGLLVAAIVRRCAREGAGDGSAARWLPLACAALFVTFPLFGEPVIWLSASFDLWACGFALAAILVAGRGDAADRASTATGGSAADRASTAAGGSAADCASTGASAADSDAPGVRAEDSGAAGGLAASGVIAGSGAVGASAAASRAADCRTDGRGTAVAATAVAATAVAATAVAATAGLFLAGLLCKESIVCLPAILPALYGWRRMRRTVAATAAVAIAYIALRLALFAGPGGYLDEQGHSTLWPRHPLQQLGLLIARLILRLLVPLKLAGLPALAQPLAALASLALLAGWALAARGAGRARHGKPSQTAQAARTVEDEPSRTSAAALARHDERSHTAAATDAGVANTVSGLERDALAPLPSRRQRLSDLARAALAPAVAMLPVLALAMIDADQQGSRLLYFPVAVAAVAAGLLARALSRPPSVRTASPPAPRTGAPWAVALIVYWSLAALWNGRAWMRAAWEVEHTLAAMTAAAPRLPPRALVYVAGHDSWRGAFTWRNGIAAAARWRSLRPDLRWYLGTVAGVDRPGDGLGRDLFEIGIDGRGNAVDLTACEAALLPLPASLLATWSLPEPPDPDQDPVSPPIQLAHPAAGLQVRLGLAGRRPSRPVQGQLYWMTTGGGRFSPTDSAPFFLGPRAAAEVVLRIPAAPAPVPHPASTLRLWIQLPAAARSYLRQVRVADLPAACSAPAIVHRLR